MFRATVLFVCLCFFGLTPYSTFAMTDEQRNKIHEHFTMMGMQCMDDYPISGDDISDLKAKKMPTGEHVPCFLSCLMKKIGIMDESGMLQKESALELAKKVFDDPEELKNIGDYLHSCSHINGEAVGDGEKGCERAVLGLKCMMENASKFGFDI